MVEGEEGLSFGAGRREGLGLQRELVEESHWRDVRKDGDGLDADEHWYLLGKMAQGLGGNHRTLQLQWEV